MCVYVYVFVHIFDVLSVFDEHNSSADRQYIGLGFLYAVFRYFLCMYVRVFVSICIFVCMYDVCMRRSFLLPLACLVLNVHTVLSIGYFACM